MISDILNPDIGNKGDKTALVEGDFRVNYKELLRRIRNLSFYLRDMGIRKGDGVCLYLPNSAEFVAGFFAITNIGAVCVPVNAKYKSTELEHYISHSGSEFLLTSRDLKEESEKITSGFKTLVIKGEDADWDFLENAASNPVFEESVTDDDKAIYLFSTGSTGVPKCVARSHRNLLALAENHTSTVGWDSDDRILFVIPISHTYAFGNLISALKVGAAVHLLEDFRRKPVVDTIINEEISIFPAVPFMLDILSRYERAKELDFSSLKHVISAGAPLGEAVGIKFYETFGIHPRQLYGSSETGVISINLAGDIDKRLSSVGKPVNNVEVEIVDEENNVLGKGEEGEIIVKSPSMTDKYENLPDESESVFRNGYYFTGDIGRIDDEGYIYITGRKKLFINVSGQKVDPVEVENLILENEYVLEAAVLGEKTDTGIEYVVAYVVTDKELRASDIIEFCRGKISDIKIPTSVKFVEEIPKSPTGKVLRDRLG